MRADNKTDVSRRPRGRRYRLLKQILTCLLAGAILMVPVTSVYALDKNQIIQMTKLGMEDSAIKGAIDGAGSSLKLSPEELGELRAAGVDDEVIAYLKSTGHVKSADNNAGSSDQTAPAGDETGPAPAPAPGKEEDKQTLSKDELNKKIEQKAKELNQQKVQASQHEQQIKSMARKLPTAKNELESGDNMSAAKTYLKFLSLNPDPQSDEWYEAKYGLARALYKEGILSGAATPLLDVIRAGAQKPHFKEAFYMLEDLTKKIGYQPPVLEEMTKFYVGDMNDDFKNDFHYYLGKFFYDYGRGDLAIKYLDMVQKGAKDYPEALYLKGVAQLGKSKKTGAALKNFEAAIVAGEKEPGGNQEILQLGYLALARVFYEVGYYDVALYYYQKIPTNSARSATATFETAWTYFMKNDYKRALGTFQTLHSPYFKDWYFPDLYILESTVYLNLCKFDQSKQALAKFQKDYLDKRPLLEKYLQKTTEPKDYWTAINGIYLEHPPKAAQGLPKMFANAVLDDLAFYNIHKVIETLQKERTALKQNVGSLGEFGQQVLDRVDQQLDTKIQEGGILVQQKLSAINKELQDWDIKATQISFDIDSEEKNQLEAKLRNRGQANKGPQKGTTLLIVADDFTPWPFEGEYWRDEVNNYRSRLHSQCAAK